jgi:hypothetical protein
MFHVERLELVDFLLCSVTDASGSIFVPRGTPREPYPRVKQDRLSQIAIALYVPPLLFHVEQLLDMCLWHRAARPT